MTDQTNEALLRAGDLITFEAARQAWNGLAESVFEDQLRLMESAAHQSMLKISKGVTPNRISWDAWGAIAIVLLVGTSFGFLLSLIFGSKEALLEGAAIIFFLAFGAIALVSSLDWDLRKSRRMLPIFFGMLLAMLMITALLAQFATWHPVSDTVIWSGLAGIYAVIGIQIVAHFTRFKGKQIRLQMEVIAAVKAYCQTLETGTFQSVLQAIVEFPYLLPEAQRRIVAMQHEL